VGAWGCNGVGSGMYEVMEAFDSGGCLGPVTGTGCTSVDISVSANLQLMVSFVI